MRIAIAALLIAMAPPAFAGECAYFSSSGQSVSLSSDGDWITFDGGDGHPLTCPYVKVSYGWSEVDCGPWQGRFITGSAQMGSGIADLLVFQTEFFYWSCPEAT